MQGRPGASVADQVGEAFAFAQAHGQKEVTVQLHPPELGQVSVKLTTDGQGVRGVVVVDNPATLAQVRHEAPALAGRLAAEGIELKQFHVEMTGSSDCGWSQTLAQGGGQWSQQAWQNSWTADAAGPAGRTSGAAADMPSVAGSTTPTYVDDRKINYWV
jgi:flagellar hook-length control protein FliK